MRNFRGRYHRRRASRLTIVIAPLLLIAACSDNAPAPSAIAYDSAKEVFEALVAGGFDCREPEQLNYFYVSVGAVDAVACDFDRSGGFESELIIGVFSTVEPSRELLDDFTNELVVGPNWLISIADDPALVVDAIGGDVVADHSEYPERPARRDDGLTSAPPITSSTTQAPAPTTTDGSVPIAVGPTPGYRIVDEPSLHPEVASILDGAVEGAEAEYGFSVVERSCGDTDMGDLVMSCWLTLSDGYGGLLDIYVAPGGNYGWEFFTD